MRHDQRQSIGMTRAEYRSSCRYLRLWLARNHGFHDGNKRTSLAVTALFLQRNSFDFAEGIDNPTLVSIWKRIADGMIGEQPLAKWLR
jgi:death on curing protein